MRGIRVQDGISHFDLWFGICIGLVLGYGGLKAYQELQDFIYPLTKEVVCKKGIAYEAVDYGSNIYLKTKQECIDTTFGEEMK